MPSGSGSRSIAVFPAGLAPGSVETPLSNDLGAEAAAMLQRAFLRDTLVAAAMAPHSSVTLFHRPGHAASAAVLAPPGVELAEQPAEATSEIWQAALRRMLASSRVAALLSTDAPLIPPLALQQAFEAVEDGSSDIAIGPTTAGGCYLLAVKADHPQLFAGVDWSKLRIYEQLAERAHSFGLRVEWVPERGAVDNLAGLEKLARELSGGEDLWAEATRAALGDLRSAGVPVPAVPAPWRVEEQEVLYSSPWRTLVNDRLVTHAGERIEYAYLQTDTAVWVVPVTLDGEIMLIRQYRHPIGRFIVEVPAGGGDGDPAEIARRELAEETGGRARELIRVASYYPASAHTTHRGHVFVALDVEPGEAELESTELLRPFNVPFELALDMARRGEIGDAQSALAVLTAEPVIRAALAE